MSDDSAYAGDRRGVPLRLEKVPVSAVQAVATKFRARVIYDASVLLPVGGDIQMGSKFDTVTVTGVIGADSVLTRIPFVALLSETPSTLLGIVDFQWLDAAGDPVAYDAETEGGMFRVLMGCGDSTLRKFLLTGKLDDIGSITPNPAQDHLRIDVQLRESGRAQLRIVNLFGVPVASITDAELTGGDHQFDVDLKGLNAGAYFVVMQTPTTQRLQRFDITK
jgi:hypothetical protein